MTRGAECRTAKAVRHQLEVAGTEVTTSVPRLSRSIREDASNDSTFVSLVSMTNGVQHLSADLVISS